MNAPSRFDRRSHVAPVELPGYRIKSPELRSWRPLHRHDVVRAPSRRDARSQGERATSDVDGEHLGFVRIDVSRVQELTCLLDLEWPRPPARHVVRLWLAGHPARVVHPLLGPV